VLDDTQGWSVSSASAQTHDRRRTNSRRIVKAMRPPTILYLQTIEGEERMRMSKYFGALLVVLAFSMSAVATASAEEHLWKWLPGTVGETFTGKLHEKTTATLQEVKGAAIKCTALSVLLEGSELVKEGSTEGKDATLALAVLHFTGCKALGLEVHSKGDAKEVILAHVEIHNCLIEWLKEAHLDGVLILPLEVVLESGANVLTTVLDKKTTGFVAPLKKVGVSEYLLDARQTEGVQEVKKCEGGEENSLKTLLAKATEEKNAGEEIKVLLLFDKTFDKEEVLS
jgi:hypothetical protein